ncbi:MAG TPA: DUF1003 domain-containing protein [Candidatus Dormibacteraeota bacterium]|jgi:uncharacterized membrane protein|nr:DUF1003 domain-containing protein [Candidatus Dormibacteraeota bacterium]HEX2681115.1 DUF1003 domain-containing protein [Candidatus Dormibacteraeota bacterium]
MSIAREIEDIARDLIKHQHDHPPVRDLNREVERRQTFAERVADEFARLIGSWVFVAAQIGIMVVWIGLNAFNLLRHWDPYPFHFLNFVLSLEAAIWVLVVLMALNRIADRDRLRAQHDYELNVKAEEELKALMNHLMHQDEILLQIVNRLDRGDREMKRLARRLEQLLELPATPPAAKPADNERPPISVPAP